ncbi:hypothetical protein [Burkholderia stagnalis]|uniref:hypothetical protein n=1 Tax=Burkholderia stagnalis TaxID=1503054 RepID=UPI0012DAF565|nr:hypothetical protein [Burkholderia stagnalis]
MSAVDATDEVQCKHEAKMTISSESRGPGSGGPTGADACFRRSQRARKVTDPYQRVPAPRIELLSAVQAHMMRERIVDREHRHNLLFRRFVGLAKEARRFVQEIVLFDE